MWVQRQETPYSGAGMKKQVFRLGENAFFCNSTCYVLMKLAQPARRPCNRPGFQHVMYWWIWHNLPDDLATDLHLHRTANYNQRQAFIQVNDVETKETDRTSSGHFLIVFFFSQQLFEFFQEPLGIWIVQGGAPAPHVILRYWRVHRWMPMSTRT